jgi:biofilm PGA synthesis lipoprotein PgaB
VRADIAKSSSDIERLSGVRPRVVVWPYGAHNHASDEIAQQLGLSYGLTLEPGVNTPDIPLSRMHRVLVTPDLGTAELARALQQAPRPAPLRVVQVDLDYVYDQDPAQQEANLSKLLDRIKALGVNTVFLQAYADPEGTGTASALYFPNRRLPMRADLFNRVAWQLRTRTGVAVYAWMPMLAFDLPANDPAHAHWVTASNGRQPGSVQRLSPFDPLVRAAVQDIYADLSVAASFQGVLFSDDAMLSDFEDAGDAALATYRQWGLAGDVASIRADPRGLARWTAAKIAYLTAFSRELAQLLRADHESLRTARNLFARVASDPQSQQWFAQSLPDALASYDYVALMAMPYMEEQRHRPGRWLEQLVASVAAQPGGLEKSIFELQSVDWAAGHRPVSGSTLAEQLAILGRAGARHLGYYPEDFRQGLPPLEQVRPALSLRASPGGS